MPAPRPAQQTRSLGPLSPLALREHLRFSGKGRIIDAFRRFDKDGSGELTKAEFAQAMLSLGFEATEAQVDRTWRHLDVDGDGSVPYIELDARLRDNQAAALGALRKRLAMRQRSITWLDRARAKIRQRQSQKVAGAATLFVEDESALANISWQQQGNADLNTVEAWEQRLKLRRNPIVQQSLDAWWEMAIQSARRQRPAANALEWEDYLNFYQFLYLDLLEDDYDEAEAEEAAWEDWETDSPDGETLDKRHFVDSIFEVAVRPATLPLTGIQHLHPHLSLSFSLAQAHAHSHTHSHSHAHALSWWHARVPLCTPQDMYTDSLEPGDYGGFLTELKERIVDEDGLLPPPKGGWGGVKVARKVSQPSLEKASTGTGSHHSARKSDALGGDSDSPLLSAAKAGGASSSRTLGRIPPGGSVAADGTILDANGNPVLGPDGKPLRADPRIPPGGSVAADGTILDANGNPVLGPDGKPLKVGSYDDSMMSYDDSMMSPGRSTLRGSASLPSLANPARLFVAHPERCRCGRCQRCETKGPPRSKPRPFIVPTSPRVLSHPERCRCERCQQCETRAPLPRPKPAILPTSPRRTLHPERCRCERCQQCETKAPLPKPKPPITETVSRCVPCEEGCDRCERCMATLLPHLKSLHQLTHSIKFKPALEEGFPASVTASSPSSGKASSSFASPRPRREGVSTWADARRGQQPYEPGHSPSTCKAHRSPACEGSGDDFAATASSFGPGCFPFDSTDVDRGEQSPERMPPSPSDELGTDRAEEPPADQRSDRRQVVQPEMANPREGRPDSPRAAQNPWADTWGFDPTSAAASPMIRLPHTGSYSRLILRSAHRLLRESTEAQSHGEGQRHGHLMRSLELTSAVTSGPSARLNPLRGSVEASLLSQGRHRGHRDVSSSSPSLPVRASLRTAGPFTHAHQPYSETAFRSIYTAAPPEDAPRTAGGGRVRILEPSKSAPELISRPLGDTFGSRSDFSAPSRLGSRRIQSRIDLREPGSWSTLRRDPATFARTCTATLFKGPVGGRPH